MGICRLLRDLRSSGAATLRPKVDGPLARPIFSGSASIANGRVRQLSLPHSLDAINGQISFDAGGVRIDSVRARLASGDVAFGGRVALVGFAPGELNLTAVGQQMRIRYPEGFVSNIDADLSLIGAPSSPLLRGTVTVRDALYSKRFEPNADLFSRTAGAPLAGAAAAAGYPLRFACKSRRLRECREQPGAHGVSADGSLARYERTALFGARRLSTARDRRGKPLLIRAAPSLRDPARIDRNSSRRRHAVACVPSVATRGRGITGTAAKCVT